MYKDQNNHYVIKVRLIICSVVTIIVATFFGYHLIHKQYICDTNRIDTSGLERSSEISFPTIEVMGADIETAYPYENSKTILFTNPIDDWGDITINIEYHHLVSLIEKDSGDKILASPSVQITDIDVHGENKTQLLLILGRTAFQPIVSEGIDYEVNYSWINESSNTPLSYHDYYLEVS